MYGALLGTNNVSSLSTHTTGLERQPGGQDVEEEEED
jgi:hypothetical protein